MSEPTKVSSAQELQALLQVLAADPLFPCIWMGRWDLLWVGQFCFVWTDEARQPPNPQPPSPLYFLA